MGEGGRKVDGGGSDKGGRELDGKVHMYAKNMILTNDIYWRLMPYQL